MSKYECPKCGCLMTGNAQTCAVCANPRDIDSTGNVCERSQSTSAGLDAAGAGGAVDMGRTTAAPLPVNRKDA